MSLWDNRNFKPMLLKEIDNPFSSNEYLFELKYDGIRALMFISPNEFNIYSRNNKNITYLYPELESLKSLVKKNTIIDGEIVIMDNNGPSFTKLQKRNNLRNKEKIKFQSKNNPVIFIAFDILYQEKDLTNLPLLERKKVLNKISDNDLFIKSKIFKHDGISLFKNVKKNSLEGIVAKKIDSLYKINTRSSDWVKIKNKKEETFFIGGYKKKKNGISILLGEKINNKLYYVGSAILRYNNKLYNKVLNNEKQENSPFINYSDDNTNYIKVNLKCNIIFAERTKDNYLRQPIIKK